MDRTIPRVRFDINPEDPINGVKCISLVDEPAIESDFVAFSKAKAKPMFIELRHEKYRQIVAGLALIPDKDILRLDSNGNPYNGYFTSESIEAIRTKFHKELLTNRVNTDHNPDNYIDAFLIESFIIDSDSRLADVKSKGIEEAVMGSWFVAYKIEDAATFQRVLNGELKGFSVEIFLQQFYKVNNNQNVFQKGMKGFLNKLKALLQEFEAGEKEVSVPDPEQKLAEGKTSDGQTVQYGEVGEPVNIVDADGVSSPASDGEYTLDNGKTVVVASGVATEIKDAPAEEAPVEQKKEGKSEVKMESEQKASEEVDDKKELMSEVEKLKAQVEELKKKPLADPVVNLGKKKVKIDESKLSNADKLRLKYGIYETAVDEKPLSNADMLREKYKIK